MDKYSIKTIEKNDLIYFVNLWNQEVELLTSSKLEMTIEKAIDGYNKKLFDYLGIYKNNQLVGFILLGETGDNIWIKHFLVDKKERRKGLGKKLLEEVLRKSKEKIIFVEVIKENLIAKEFFLKNGFRIIKDNKNENQFILKYQ